MSEGTERDPDAMATEDRADLERRSGGNEFPCPQCGATMRWDPDADALACEYCGHRAAVECEEGAVVERSLEEAGEAARGYGLELRVTRCGSCGASVTFEGAATSDVCVYCGSANVLAQEANRNAIRPESLIPLDVGRAAVEKRFRRWLKRLWLRPSALKRTRHFEAVGVYAPFWTFDCRVHSEWSAQAGRYEGGHRRQVAPFGGKHELGRRAERRVRWRPARGSRDDVFDDLLVHASAGESRALVRRLGHFDTSTLVPYRPEYLAGWRAEEYRVDLDQAWSEGIAEVRETQRRRCAADVPGDTHRDLRVRDEITDVRWKHVLLPLWSLQYRFRGKVYTVLMHGQNGHVVGEAPYSPVKVALFSVACAVVVLVLLTLMGSFR